MKNPKYDSNTQVTRRGDTFEFEFFYPRSPKTVKFLEVGLSDVRAADNIRISYDFDRDGWKIEQARVFSWDGDDTICDPQWKEVALVRAWASQEVP